MVKNMRYAKYQKAITTDRETNSKDLNQMRDKVRRLQPSSQMEGHVLRNKFNEIRGRINSLF